MPIKLDENVPNEAVELFSKAGHSADTVHDEQLVGRPDSVLAEVCRRERRTLVTLDLDFSDIRVYPPQDYAGMIVLRPRKQNKPAVIALLKRMLTLLGQEPLDGRLWIIDEVSLRIRGDTDRSD